MKYFIFCFAIASFFISCNKKREVEINDQNFKITLLSDSLKSSIRGMDFDEKRNVWFSGSAGVILKIIDDKIIDISPFLYSKLDFRSINVFNVNEAIVMNAGSPTIILKTKDGGANWYKVYTDSSENAFYNAIGFWNDSEGIAFGDPINNKFSIIKTIDKGETWFRMDSFSLPKSFIDEAGFAASGTNMFVEGDSHLYYLTGGSHSRMLFSGDKGNNWLSFDLPIRQGKASEGGYSFDINSKGNIVVVGGDYTEANNGENSSCISSNSGVSWKRPNTFPSGYRSCVEFIDDSTLITVGTSGIDISIDYGYKWSPIDTIYNLNVIKSINDSLIYAAGNGVIVKILK